MKLFLVLMFDFLFANNDLIRQNACFARAILLFHFFAALLSSMIKHPTAKFLYSINRFVFVHDVSFSVSVGLASTNTFVFRAMIFRSDFGDGCDKWFFKRSNNCSVRFHSHVVPKS